MSWRHLVPLYFVGVPRLVLARVRDFLIEAFLDVVEGVLGSDFAGGSFVVVVGDLVGGGSLVVVVDQKIGREGSCNGDGFAVPFAAN